MTCIIIFILFYKQLVIYIHVYNNIGVSLKKQEKVDDALEYFQRSFKIALTASKPNPELIAIICTNVADILLAQNQIEPAITCVKSALDIALQHLPSNHSSLASIYLS
jgi:tetratricopeptide (TPR) repeat protein